MNEETEPKRLTLRGAIREIEELAVNYAKENAGKFADGFFTGLLRAKAIIYRAEAESGWQPIETAPEEEMLLVIHQHLGVIQATLSSKMLVSDVPQHREFPWDSPAGGDFWIYTRDLTHWRPMIELPTKSKP